MAPEWNWALAPFTAILIATPCAALEFSDDFADNLLTDLAPVLTLFGERVTMQFLSQSTGWADVIILTMAPLGIMTIIVSAIRVGGPSWLKAAIGRSRENLAVAEVDLMSSTSTEVCELWNGREIVRSMGSAPVREFICISPRPVSESPTSDEEPGQSPTSWYPLIHRSPHHVVAREKRNGAPNIALNLQEHPRREVHAAALLAICLQAGVLVYSGFATYYPTLRFPKEKDTPVANYAFPCMATGTLCLVAGLLLCGHVVESSTEERITKMADGYQAYYIWLQRYATVGDQVFGSFAIFSSDPLSTVVTSRRSVKYEPTILDQVFLAVPDYLLNLASGKRNGPARRNQRRQQHTALLASKTTIGMLFSLCGFIVQFVGLRGLHWSISVFQLGAVLIMTLVRVYIRRDFARPPLACQLPIRFELDWFAMSLMEKDPAPWLNPSSNTTDSTEEEDEDQEKIDNGSESPVSNRSWRVITTNLTECESLKPQMPRQLSRSHEAITLRKQLGDLTGWRSIAQSQAKILKLAIDLTLERLADYYPEENLIWSVETEFNGVPSQTVNFEVTGAKRGWTAVVLEAALSLWLYSVDQQRRNFRKSHFPDSYPPWAKDMNQGGDETMNLWSGTDTGHPERHLRSLGHDSKQLRRDLQWWAPRDGEPFEVIWIESAEAPRREFRGSFDRTRAGGPGLDIPWFNEDHMEAPVIFYTTHSQKKGIAFDVDDGNPQADGIITSRVSGTSQMFYTQELFSSFMWALAKTMTARIGGSTDLQLNTVSVDNPLDSFMLSNKILSTLISDIHNTGLASLDTVFSLVIPPLSAVNKLPDATSVITLARQEARPYEQRGDLFTAGKTYVWLVRAMSTFPSTSEVRVKATAVLLQHVKQVEKEMDHWKKCIGLHEVVGFDLLQKHQDMIVKELKADENHEVLMELYRYRNRFTKFEGVAWSKAAPEEKLPSVLGFTAAHAFAKMPRPPYDLFIYLDHINLPDAFGRTPIHYAATLAQSSIIQIVMDIKGRVDAEDLEGKTPLHYACEGVGDGTDKIVRNLLKAGAEINKQARDGSRPIHCAAESGAVETLRTLAEAGAIVDSLDVMGKTPLMLAALGAHKDAVEYLLPISNTSLRDTHGRNVLHMAALSGDIDVLGLLAEDMYYSPDRNGHTPLNLAAFAGHADTMRFLMSRFDTQDEFDNPKGPLTPLHSAISAGQVDIVRVLIGEYHVDKETPDGAGWRPLHCAVWAGRYDMVKLLIEEYGVDRESQTKVGWTPLFVAAAIDRGLALVRPLMEVFKCDAKARDHNKETLLHLLAQNTDTDLPRYVIEHQGIDVDARDVDGRTALITAIRMGMEGTMRMLVLELGADVNARDNQGQTPLHNAMKLSANRAAVSAEVLLRELGADVHAQSKRGDTPLHIAARQGHREVLLKLIQEFGADAKSLNEESRTPLQIAALNGIDIDNLV